MCEVKKSFNLVFVSKFYFISLLFDQKCDSKLVFIFTGYCSSKPTAVMHLFKPAPIRKHICVKIKQKHIQTVMLPSRACFLASKKSNNFNKDTNICNLNSHLHLLTCSLYSSSKTSDTRLSTNNKVNYNAKNGIQSDFSEIDFNNVEDAYNSKTTSELFRALFVFHLCNFNWLVSHGLQVSIFVNSLILCINEGEVAKSFL